MPGCLSSTSPRFAARFLARSLSVRETEPWARPSPDSGWARTTTSSMMFSGFESTDISSSAESGAAKSAELSANTPVAAPRALRWYESKVKMCISTPCAKKTGRPALLEDSDQYSGERELLRGSPWVCLTKARQKEMAGCPTRVIGDAEDFGR